MLASEPMQQVFENILEASKGVQVTISTVDDSNYEIEGQTPSLKHHNISPFKISLSHKKLGTLIWVQDEIEGKSNSMFIDALINNLGKQI